MVIITRGLSTGRLSSIFKVVNLRFPQLIPFFRYTPPSRGELVTPGKLSQGDGKLSGSWPTEIITLSEVVRGFCRPILPASTRQIAVVKVRSKKGKVKKVK